MVAGGLAAVIAGPSRAPLAALAAAALAHAAGALAGDDEPAAWVACAAGAWVAAAATAQTSARSALAIAMCGWSIGALVRLDRPAVTSIALVPATAAAALNPACVALLPIAGSAGARRRAPWVVVGVIATLVAVMAGVADHGPLATLAAAWFDHPRGALDLRIEVMIEAGGPLLAVAALAGLALVARVTHPGLAILCCVIGSVVVDVRAGEPGPLTMALAAVLAAVAVCRFARSINIASGRIWIAATCGVVLMVPALLTVLG